MKTKWLTVVVWMMAATATAETYIVSSQKGGNQIKSLAASAGPQTCVYADKVVQPGDTVALKDSNIVMVCAKSSRGGVFYQVTPKSAKEVAALARSADPM